MLCVRQASETREPHSRTPKAIRDPEQTHLRLDPGSHSASLPASGDVANLHRSRALRPRINRLAVGVFVRIDADEMQVAVLVGDELTDRHQFPGLAAGVI